MFLPSIVPNSVSGRVRRRARSRRPRFGHTLLPACSLAIGLGLMPPSPAEAACSAGNFSLDFGSVNVLTGGNVDFSTTFTVTCSGLLNLSGSAGISCGTGGNCTSNLRTLVSGSNTMRVEYYSDASRTSVWQAGFAPNPGSYTGGALSLSLGNTTRTYTVYGRIPSGQTTVKPGSYTWSGGLTPSVRYCTDLFCLFQATDTPASASQSTATVPDQCLINSTTGVGFTPTGLITSALQATGTITVQCTNGTAYSVLLDNGLNASGSTRRMKHSTAAEYVTYDLYRDSTRTLRWGATVGSDVLTGTGTGGSQALSVYGLVPVPASTPQPGSYADTITVTVSY